MREEERTRLRERERERLKTQRIKFFIVRPLTYNWIRELPTPGYPRHSINIIM